MKGTNVLVRPVLLGAVYWVENRFDQMEILSELTCCVKALWCENRINWENWRQASYFETPKKKEITRWNWEDR